MVQRISNRIAAFIDALPLAPGQRVLEIGCGPGVAARAVSRRVGNGFVLAIDRSAKAIESAVAGSKAEIATGRLRFIQATIEDLHCRRVKSPSISPSRCVSGRWTGVTRISSNAPLNGCGSR